MAMDTDRRLSRRMGNHKMIGTGFRRDQGVMDFDSSAHGKVPQLST